MKLKNLILVVFGIFLTSTVQAMPSTIQTDVYLTSYVCGDDSCYITFEPSDITGISVTAWCSDKKYCDKLYYMAEQNYGVDINLNQTEARISMTQEENPFSGTSTYNVTDIRLLK